jgi:Helix-turn-helix domain
MKSAIRGRTRALYPQGSACRPVFPGAYSRSYPAVKIRVLELMDDITTLGAYLRAERERRDLALKTISESTKVSLPLLEGLESDDISRWPGGIFRRAFVRSYAEAVGLDPDDVFQRFERQYRPASDTAGIDPGQPPRDIVALAQATGVYQGSAERPSNRARILGTAADLTVALVLAFGSAAAGSRLLWPVLLIAAYYAAGILFTGTSPMVALIGEPSSFKPSSKPRRVISPGRVNDENVESLLGHSSHGAIS